MADPAFPEFPHYELTKANQDIADCLALARTAMEAAAKIADHYKIVVAFDTPLAQAWCAPRRFYYNPERDWLNSDHKCAVENYSSPEYGWTEEEPELTEVDPDVYRYW